MSFSGDVAKFTTKAKNINDKVFRSSAIQLFTDIVKMTPVDTGRLRANWQPSFGSPSTTETQADGDPTAQIKAYFSAAKLNQVLYLANNLPYATAIEYDGHSAQAPAGMVRVNAARWSRIVEENRRRFSGGAK